MANKERSVVFLPVTAGQAARLLGETVLAGPLRGFTATEQLCATFGLPSAGEEADFAAFQVASVAALLTGEAPLVLVAAPTRLEVGDEDERGNGAVEVDGLTLSAVGAFFTEGRAGESRSARRAAVGKGVDGAWDLPQVQTLLAEQPLVWHDVSELADHLQTREG